MPTNTKSIFISYRREDKYPVEIIYKALIREFGQGVVFKDNESIPLGYNFREHINKELHSCQILIAVIGKNWLNATDEQDKRCLDNPEDFVRREIATALERNILIIPIFLDGVDAPKKIELPEELKDLVFRQGKYFIDSSVFDVYIEQLIQEIKAHLSELAKTYGNSLLLSSLATKTPRTYSQNASQLLKSMTAYIPFFDALKGYQKIIALTLSGGLGFFFLAWGLGTQSTKVEAHLQRLAGYLSKGYWREADQETLNIILRTLNKKEGDQLILDDVERFPREELRKIDQLWLKFSSGRFGFSVQSQIYIETGNKPNQYPDSYENFGNRIGWRVNNRYLLPKDFIFDISAPEGHLPSTAMCVDFGGCNGTAWIGIGWWWPYNFGQKRHDIPSPTISKNSNQDYECKSNELG